MNGERSEKLPHPYRLHAYQDVRDIALRLNEINKILRAQARMREEAEGVWVTFRRGPARTLELSSLGSDQARIVYISGLSPENTLLRVAFDLYADGSPFLAPGDEVLTSGQNGYDAIFGPEIEPFIVQYFQTETYAKNSIPLGHQIRHYKNKHLLTDQDCRNIVAFMIDSASLISP